MKLLLIIAVFSAVGAVFLWGAFVKPVPTSTATGTITKKSFKPAGTYWQYPAGSNRSFLTPTAIPIAEAYIFQVKVNEFDGPIFFSLNTVAAKAFEPGQKVLITYRERSIPLLWKRRYVVDISAVK